MNRRKRSTGQTGTQQLNAKAFIALKPPPVTTEFSVQSKLLARTTGIYTLHEPEREVVRKWNYERRKAQLSSQGYRTPSHKPYASIGGEPILDDELLVRTALGQPKEIIDETDAINETLYGQLSRAFLRSRRLKMKEFHEQKVREQSGMAPTRPHSRAKEKKRQMYDPNELRNVLASGTKSVRSVSCLGKSWFDLIERPNSATSSLLSRKSPAQVKREKEQAQSLKMRDLSDSEDSCVEELDYNVSVLFENAATAYEISDDDLGADEHEKTDALKRATFSANLKKRYVRASTAKSGPGHLNTAANTTALSGYLDGDASEEENANGSELYEDEVCDETIVLSGFKSADPPLDVMESATVVRKPKVGLEFRPFTPSLNINQKFNRQTSATLGRKDKTSGSFSVAQRDEILYRQLCVLLWIFNNLTVEPNYKYSSLATCYSELNPGGKKIHKTKLAREKSEELLWETDILSSRSKKKSSCKPPVPGTLLANRVSTAQGRKNAEKLKTAGSRRPSATSRSSSVVSFADTNKSTRSHHDGGQVESIMDHLGIHAHALLEEIIEEKMESGSSRVASSRASSMDAGIKSQPASGLSSSSNKVSRDQIFASTAEPGLRKPPLEQLTEDEAESVFSGSLNVTATHEALCDDSAKEPEGSHYAISNVKSIDYESHSNDPKSCSESTQDVLSGHKIPPSEHKEKFENNESKEEQDEVYEDEFDSEQIAEDASKVPVRMRDNWNQLKLEQGLQMRDFLSQHGRVQSKISRAKLSAVGEALNASKSTTMEFNRALSRIRAVSTPIYQHDKESQRQYVEWYQTLLEHLPESFKQSLRQSKKEFDGNSSVDSVTEASTRYLRVLSRLDELGRVGSVPSKLITGEALKRFLNDSKLRNWELCDPNVRPAIDFFCEHVASMPKSEFLDWLSTNNPDVALVEKRTSNSTRKSVEQQKVNLRTH